MEAGIEIVSSCPRYPFAWRNSQEFAQGGAAKSVQSSAMGAVEKFVYVRQVGFRGAMEAPLGGEISPTFATGERWHLFSREPVTILLRNRWI